MTVESLEETPRAPGPGPVAIAPGDDLAAAIAAAPDGAWLVLAEGRHALGRAAIVGRRLRLDGPGAIGWEGAGPALVVAAGGALSAHGLAIEGPADGAETLVRVEDGVLDWDDGALRRGGLALGGRARVRLVGCALVGAPVDGIRASGRAQLQIAGGRVAGHGGAGLVAGDRAGGSVRRALVERNGGDGARAGDRAAIAFEANLLVDNAGAGLAFAGRATGEAYGNLCQGNAGDGLLVTGRAAPLVAENVLRGNAGWALRWAEAARGVARGNAADGNRHDAARVEGEAAPLLVPGRLGVSREGTAGRAGRIPARGAERRALGARRRAGRVETGLPKHPGHPATGLLGYQA